MLKLDKLKPYVYILYIHIHVRYSTLKNPGSYVFGRVWLFVCLVVL